MANLRKQGLTALKILISVALIYFIFNKLNVAEVVETFKKANPLYLLFALVFFAMSKVIAAYRLNLYFHELKILLTQKSNLKLYLLGMFYNLFLPGGIGGDAYKGYVIKKSFEVETKKVVAVLVLDRLSGLLLLFIYACALAMVINNDDLANFKILIGFAIPLSMVVFYFLNAKFFDYVLPVFWKSIAYSAFVQLSQLVCVFFILKSLGIESNGVAYLLIFLISSIVSVIPLTIGGIGSRELTFFYGAAWLGLTETTSVGISILFFLITALVSLFGILYHFKKVKLETIKS
ncbi:MAG: lysylphosphatidylglycerol synthase transmembrane domain-containing protein [Maribacter sp.]|uniref:lysylphosphatidylglycerol synthase transmembrane domain-containing protein n=1 Tax=Maribacter sp. TaxID=1897614 RepID=UPI003298224B